VVAESHLRYNDSMRDTKHLESFARQRVQKEKEKTLFKNKIKAVHKGANGTFEYTIKEGVNKGKIADNRILKN
jgi:hypothetical protein